MYSNIATNKRTFNFEKKNKTNETYKRKRKGNTGSTQNRIEDIDGISRLQWKGNLVIENTVSAFYFWCMKDRENDNLFWTSDAVKLSAVLLKL